jgi:hypothetical protein
MGDHEALVAEFAQMPPEQVAQILEAAKQVLLSAQPPGGAPSPSPTDPSAAPQGLAQSEVGDGGLDAGVPSGPANEKPSETKPGFPGTANNGGSPMHPGTETGNMHAKLASPSNLVPTSTLKGETDGGPMNPGRETGATRVPDASMLGTTTQTPDGGFHSPARKSEVDAELETLRKANKELEARFEGLVGVVTELVEKPIRKAITGIDYVNIRGVQAAPAASLSKSLDRAEITKRLNEKVKDPSLTKHDRELITDAYETRNFSKIEHLLK